MATVTSKELEDLVAQVKETPGWDVKDLGTRWRVTNSEGGGPCFIPKRPPAHNTLKGIMVNLQERGWDEAKAAEAREADRQQRLEEDRRRNERALYEAQRQIEQTELQQLREAATARQESANTDVLRGRIAQSVDTGDGVRKEVLEIDATFAKELLGYNNFFVGGQGFDPDAHMNRALSMNMVNEYRDAMLRGEWRRSHQGIAFDRNMNLVDGQHRLLALIEAAKVQPGITITTEVTYDLDPAVFPVIDTGKKRTTSDVLALHGLTNRIALAATIKLVYLYENFPVGAWTKVRISTQQTLELADKYGDAIHDAVRRGTQCSKVMIPSAASAGVYLCQKAMPGVDMDDFLWGLRTGQELAAGDPRLALRGFMERLRAQRRRTSNNVEQLGLFIKTWNAYVEGRPLYQTRLRANEAFPRPIESGTVQDLKAWEERRGDHEDDADAADVPDQS